MLTAEQLNDLRQRVLAKDENLTREEIAKAVRQMVTDRIDSLNVPKAKESKKKPAKQIPNLDDLLVEKTIESTPNRETPPTEGFF